MEHVINLLNSPVIGKKSSFSFVLLLTGLGITSLQSSIVDDLPELNLSPITPAFEETVVEHTFDSRPDFSYENEPLVHKREMI